MFVAEHESLRIAERGSSRGALHMHPVFRPGPLLPSPGKRMIAVLRRSSLTCVFVHGIDLLFGGADISETFCTLQSNFNLGRIGVVPLACSPFSLFKGHSSR